MRKHTLDSNGLPIIKACIEAETKFLTYTTNQILKDDSDVKYLKITHDATWKRIEELKDELLECVDDDSGS